MTKRMTMNNLKEKIKNKIGDIVKYLFDRFIGCPDIHSIQKYLNNQGLLVYNHYDAFDDQIYDVYFNLSNLDNVTFKCEDISWGSLNSNYIKTFKNQPYLHIGKIDCSNNQVACYKYLTKFTIENDDGKYVSHCKCKATLRFKNFTELLYNQIEELRLQLKEYRENKLLDDINKDF